MPPVSYRKRNLSILKPAEVLSSPLLMWLFQRMWNEQKSTHWAPLRPPSLRNKTEENTPLGRDVSQEFLSSSGWLSKMM